MAEITVPGPVNLGHVSHLLGAAAVRSVGPRGDGTTTVTADVTVKRLRDAITAHDPAWTPPPTPPDLESAPGVSRQQIRALAALTGKTPREVAKAFRDAAPSGT